MNLARKCLLSTAALVTLTACTTPAAKHVPSSTDASGLEDTHWRVQRLGEDASAAVSALTLEFVGGDRIAGHDGCNAFSGGVALSRSTIAVSDRLMGTMMACASDVEARARAYREALVRARALARADGSLRLMDADGKTLATFAAASTSLSGTHWEAVSYHDGKQAVISLRVGTRITARFSDDGRMTGNGGCNNYFASYSVTENSISIGPAGTTRRVCAEPGGLMEQEAQYLRALTEATNFRLSADRLELRGASGTLLAAFSRSRIEP